MLTSYHERTQHLFHHVQPVITGPEKRHLFCEDDENPRVNTFYDLGTQMNIEERKGVLHLVQCWHQQGHPNVSPFFSLLSFFLISPPLGSWSWRWLFLNLRPPYRHR
jgi:hypothetical protein